MIGTVMISNNTNSSQTSRNSELLLTTTTTANSVQQQINTISSIISNKYQQQQHQIHAELSDTEMSEKVSNYYSKTRSCASSKPWNKQVDELSINSQIINKTSVYSSTHRNQQCNNSTEPPLPSLPPPQNPYDQSEPTYEKLRPLRNQEKIQVQILPMDDNWGANTTAHTADFSDFNDDMTEDGRSSHFNFNYNKQKNSDYQTPGLIKTLFYLIKNYFGIILALLVSFSSFLSPILFILIPKTSDKWQLNECGLECEGLLIGIAFKLFILLIGYWAVFVRTPLNSLPRIYELRAFLVLFLSIITFSYWLFYSVRIIETQTQDFYKILQFTVSYLDVLLFIFIISVFVLELRHLKPKYVVKIVRSPDGEQQELVIGDMSVQRAALYILEQYYTDFKVYNPWLENAHRKRAVQLMQIEQANRKKDDDLNTDQESNKKSRKSKFNMVGTNVSANDRLYEEYEYDRRLKKRKARLLMVTEEAFNHVRRINAELDLEAGETHKSLMDPFEAAQAVFTSIARDLRRYLRVTRQQPYFTRESIVAHLANCISYDITPKAFLKRYIDGEPLVFNDRALELNQQRNRLNENLSDTNRGNNYTVNLKTLDQTWILISDSALYQSIQDNLMFVLKQNEVTLMCSFKRLPRFNLIEDILDPKRNKFVLKINSETTV